MIDNQKDIKAEMSQKQNDVNVTQYCVIRSHGAGVFCGYIKERKAEANGVNIELANSRRIHYWVGACSLSQLAIEGLKDLENSRIAMLVPTEYVSNVIECIPMTESAAKQIQGAPVWKC